jgi:cyanate permease
MRPLLTAEYFGARHVGKILGAASVVVNVSAISPAVTGYLFDVTGSYEIPFAVAAVVAVGAALVFALVRNEHALRE